MRCGRTTMERKRELKHIETEVVRFAEDGWTGLYEGRRKYEMQKRVWMGWVDTGQGVCRVG